jgi:SAM-dependent methyltransferase
VGRSPARLPEVQGAFAGRPGGTTLPLGPAGQPDLRLAGPLEVTVPSVYDPSLVEIPESVWRLSPEVEAHMGRAQQLNDRGQKDLVAWLLASVKPGAVVLDLGAKSNRDKKLIESLGAKYVAIEISAKDAMILGDAHAIPLLDASVDVLLCMSVFEHLKNPFLAEVRRVLRPGGHFIGIVGFLESVHGLPHGSFFHHSYLGIYSLLKSAGFNLEYMAVETGWQAIHSISRAMLPGVPKGLTKLLTKPLEGMQSLAWYAYGVKSGDVARARRQRQRNLSASVKFVATNE